MLKYTQRVILKHEREMPASGEGRYTDVVNDRNFADTIDLRVTLAQAMSEVPDSQLVFLAALGYEDSELSEGNLRMRRFRARKQLQIALVDDLALSA
jgi:hypothetical protein